MPKRIPDWAIPIYVGLGALVPVVCSVFFDAWLGLILAEMAILILGWGVFHLDGLLRWYERTAPRRYRAPTTRELVSDEERDFLETLYEGRADVFNFPDRQPERREPRRAAGGDSGAERGGVR
ncbi:MAG: hypothetical protein K0U84_13515 [Actinomycetia bacterium]|nr:hypothetical protein [Actinomycetes bacterium]